MPVTLEWSKTFVDGSWQILCHAQVLHRGSVFLINLNPRTLQFLINYFLCWFRCGGTWATQVLRFSWWVSGRAFFWVVERLETSTTCWICCCGLGKTATLGRMKDVTEAWRKLLLIQAKTIVMSAAQDLYFPVAERSIWSEVSVFFSINNVICMSCNHL